jgi:hypothetical protein
MMPEPVSPGSKQPGMLLRMDLTLYQPVMMVGIRQHCYYHAQFTHPGMNSQRVYNNNP